MRFAAYANARLTYGLAKSETDLEDGWERAASMFLLHEVRLPHGHHRGVRTAYEGLAFFAAFEAGQEAPSCVTSTKATYSDGPPRANEVIRPGLNIQFELRLKTKNRKARSHKTKAVTYSENYGENWLAGYG